MTTIEFEQQFKELRHPLLHFAFRLTRNQEDAFDLLQETMGKAFKHLETFQVDTNFRAWVVTIMRNLFINQYRKKKVRNMQLEPIDNHLYNLEKSGVANAGESRMTVNEIRGIIDRLDRSYSEPFLLHFRGYKYEEIADKMGIPIGTVKSRIYVARQKLQADIKVIYN